MHMVLYNGLLWIGAPLLDHHLAKRLKSGKEDIARYGERLGTPSRARPEGQLIWIHAASVGEAVSALALIETLLDQHTERHVLVTTGTRTSADIMQARLPDRAFHQYVPIDRKSAVCHFLDYWRPDLAIWMESEVWPNLIWETSARRIPMMMLNARITEKSFKKWNRSLGFAKRLLGCFDYCSAQTEASAQRLADLGARKVEYLGNLKFASDPLPFSGEDLSDLSGQLKGRKFWLAASTHAGEEEVILEAHVLLAAAIPGLLTLIVPRHPERGNDIRTLAEEKQLKAAMRSQGQKITPETDIYIADTIGELGVFYRLAGVVFIGGSLAERGGQNPMEAAHLDCAILHGPRMENFLEIAGEFDRQQAWLQVETAQDLSDAVAGFLSDEDRRREIGEKAAAVVSTGADILKTTVARVEDLLKGGRREGS